MANETTPTGLPGSEGATLNAPGHIRSWPAAITWDGPWTPVGLYLCAVSLLTIRLGSHPAFPYNWESYTARDALTFWAHPTWNIFNLNDGVMTDSGLSPLIALPVWVGFQFLGVGLFAMRLPIVLIAGLAVPLTWLVGRHLAGAGTAVLGAALLALSPVFLLYGRTATLVGVSLVPALATMYALLRVIDHRPSRGRWLIALQLLLLLDAYAYSPIRFLWPLSLVLLIGELVWRRGDRRWFLIATIVTAIALPLGITGAYHFVGYRGWDTSDPAIVSYYSGHGEQLANLIGDPTGIQRYIRAGTPGQPNGTATRLALRLVRQNATDLARLLLDRETLPAITDYWNANGRLYPWFLVPFFLNGSLVMLWRARSSVQARAWLVLFWGLSLPMLLTSRVHVGRLIFIVPLLMLIVALGMTWSARNFWEMLMSATQPIREGDRQVHARWATVAARILATGAIALILSTVARSTWTDYSVAPNSGSEVNIAGILRANARSVPSGAGFALMLAPDAAGLEGEALTVSGVRVMMDRGFHFIDVQTRDPEASVDTRTPVYFGGLLVGSLAAQATIPTFCQNVYVVPDSNRERFLTLTATPAENCPAPLRVVTLPG